MCTTHHLLVVFVACPLPMWQSFAGRSNDAASICAGEHKHTDCDKRDQPKCAACGGPHPAMSNSCPRYIQAKTATAISVTEGRLYSDALRMVRTQEKQKTSPPTSTPVASSSQG